MVLVLVVALTFAALIAELRRAAPTVAAARGATLALIGWPLSIAVAAWMGALEAPSDPARPPPVVIASLAASGAWIALLAVGPVRRWVQAVPVAARVRLHVGRVSGALLWWAAARGELPWVFAGPAGAGGVLVAAAALAVAARAAARPAEAAPLLRAFAVLGLADLALAMTLGALTAPGPLQVWAHELSSAAASRWPLALTPTLLVPLSLALHLATWPRGAASRSPARAG